MEGLVPKFQKFIKHHNSTILTVLGSFGVIGTAVVTAKVTPKAGELIQAVSKVERKGLDFEKQNLIDEIVDMYISLMAIRARYEISEKEIQERIEHKLNKKY